MIKHGIYANELATSVVTPVEAESGVPFVIGAAPVQAAESPVAVGVPVLCNSWDEAAAHFGYSDDWEKYPLCEFMYSHFKLYGCAPVILCNLLDPTKMMQTVAAADVEVASHKVILPAAAIARTLVIKASGGTGDAYVAGTDYDAYYDGENLCIEVIAEGCCYDAALLNVAYSEVTPASVDAAAIATGLESIEHCATRIGIVPDLICAPGFSNIASVAAVMAAKANGINGMFKAKALIDLDAGTVRNYADAVAAKNAGAFDETEVVCWPMLALDGKRFHMSTQLAGLMAQVDTGNDGCPYESPSNKSLKCDSMILADGTEVALTHARANILNANGIVTALNFLGGWVAWGNYTACYPANIDVKDYFIPVSRMFGWVSNSIIKTFWTKLDKPMNSRLRDSILDTLNIWLNGLVGSGYLLGGTVEFRNDENPDANLMAGILKFHLMITPPSPAQEIDFILEYDASAVSAARSE